MARYKAVIKKTEVSFAEVTIGGLSKESVEKIAKENKKTYTYSKPIETTYEVKVKKVDE